MNIETERMLIRNFCMDDTEELYQVLSDQETMTYIESPYTYEQTQNFIMEAGLSSSPLVFALVLKETGKVIGHVIYHTYDDTGYEIGWVINKKYWGAGFAREITEAMIHYSREMKAGSLILECDYHQAASKQIALKSGFQYEGRENNLDIYRLKLI